MIQKLLYLADWQIFITIGMIGTVLVNILGFFQLRKRVKIFADLKTWQAIILTALATSFVIGPILLLWLFISLSSTQGQENTIQSVAWQNIMNTYSEFIEELFSPLMNSHLVQTTFLMVPALGLFFSVYFLPLLLALAIPVILSFRQKNFKERAQLLGLTIITGIGSTIILASIIYILMIKIATPIVDQCWQRTGGLSQFRAHLEELCVNRENTSECPRDEGALIAFNPRGYAQAQSCTNLSYKYHPEKGALWVVQAKFNSFTIYQMRQGKLTVLTRPYTETKQIEQEYE